MSTNLRRIQKEWTVTQIMKLNGQIIMVEFVEEALKTFLAETTKNPIAPLEPQFSRILDQAKQIHQMLQPQQGDDTRHLTFFTLDEYKQLGLKVDDVITVEFKVEE